MDFIDQIRAIAARIPKTIEHTKTEEATKNAYIMPFINALGYNVFDPTEVVPEYIADVGSKKGEKVDYAIMNDGKAIMIYECKWSGANLSEENASQLRRYFSVVESRIGVLTNGIMYQFYSDLEKPNIMDQKPFLIIDMMNIKEPLINELKKLTKGSFNIEEMLSTASELKYTRAIKAILRQEFNDPSEDFVRFFANQVYNGRVTQSVRKQFAEIVHFAAKQFMNDTLNERLQGALSSDLEEEPSGEEQEIVEVEAEADNNGIVTTEEELEGWHIVRAILRESVDVYRITHRDTKSYMGILLDDNNRKPICRLHFNRTQKYLTVFDGSKNSERVNISTVDEIYGVASRLKEVVKVYDST